GGQGIGPQFGESSQSCRVYRVGPAAPLSRRAALANSDRRLCAGFYLAGDSARAHPGGKRAAGEPVKPYHPFTQRPVTGYRYSFPDKDRITAMTVVTM